MLCWECKARMSGTREDVHGSDIKQKLHQGSQSRHSRLGWPAMSSCIKLHLVSGSVLREQLYLVCSSLAISPSIDPLREAKTRVKMILAKRLTARLLAKDVNETIFTAQAGRASMQAIRNSIIGSQGAPCFSHCKDSPQEQSRVHAFPVLPIAFHYCVQYSCNARFFRAWLTRLREGSMPPGPSRRASKAGWRVTYVELKRTLLRGPCTVGVAPRSPADGDVMVFVQSGPGAPTGAG
ncbi:hypothetical protein WJX82_003550 [Trebouxia sp. C0006]